MNRSVALRTFAIFTTITAFAIVAGVSSQAAIAEAIFVIGGTLALIMLAFAAALPRAEPVPIRVKSRH